MKVTSARIAWPFRGQCRQGVSGSATAYRLGHDRMAGSRAFPAPEATLAASPRLADVVRAD